MKIDESAATDIVNAAAQTDAPTIDKIWAAKIERLSLLCEGASRTHIAAFGTALLAKATDINVDVFALKVENNGPRAYSARSLAKNVLAKAALLHRFDIGVSGPEPLNNQPYFREARISREMPVRPNIRPIIDHLCTMLTQLDAIGDSEKVRGILETFISLRRKRMRDYAALAEHARAAPAQLGAIVSAFVSENSEGGKRAQAVAAAAFDIAFDADRVEAGRVNDPSRNIPGDIIIVSGSDEASVIRSIEVRDKLVELADIVRFRDRCANAGVTALGFIAVGAGQGEVDADEINRHLAGQATSLRLYWTWDALLAECLFWADGEPEELALQFIAAVRDRLVAMEASEQAVANWTSAFA